MIDESFALEVNGTRQWVLVRGVSASAPIVLFIHGGPGYPLMWFSRAFDTLLVQHLLIVHWDQRKAGKSWSPEVSWETVSLEQIAADGKAIADHLLQRFAPSKIVLVGHSWGTLVAAVMARNWPQRFHALVMCGTCPDWQRASELRFARLTTRARTSGNHEAIDLLNDLGPPPYLDAQTMARFGEVIHRVEGFSGTARQLTEDDLARAIENCPDYTEREIASTVEALDANLDHFGPFLHRYTIMSDVPRLEIPVWFVEGQHDWNCPAALSHEYFEKLVAPQGKHWCLFEQSAHFPMYEEPQRFLDVLTSVCYP